MTPDSLPAETLRDIREKAEKATPGPWDVTHSRARNKRATERSLIGAEHALKIVASWTCDARNNFEYIAACDPQTVLRLVDELERLRAEKAALRELLLLTLPPLEVIACQDATKPYTELSPEIRAKIHEGVGRVRAAVMNYPKS